MRALSVVFVSLFITSQCACAEDCTKLSSEGEQIACLQRELRTLQKRLEAPAHCGVSRKEVEELIAQKLEEAFRPSLHK
jgi:hypothetical protein